MTSAELKAEIQSGPHAATLAPFVAAGNDAAIAAFLNDPSGPGAGTVTRSTLTQQGLLRAFGPVVVSLASKTAAIKEKWDRIINLIKYMEEISPADIDSILSLAVTDGLMTAAKVTELKTRTGCRAEVLFGRLVTPTDVSETRRV